MARSLVACALVLGLASGDVSETNSSMPKNGTQRLCSMKEMYSMLMAEGATMMDASEAAKPTGLEMQNKMKMASCTPPMELPKLQPCGSKEVMALMKMQDPSEADMMAMVLNGTLTCLPPTRQTMPELKDCTLEEYVKLVKAWPKAPSDEELMMMRLNGSLTCHPDQSKALAKFPPCSSSKMSELFMKGGLMGSLMGEVGNMLGGLPGAMAGGSQPSSSSLPAGTGAGAGTSASTGASVGANLGAGLVGAVKDKLPSTGGAAGNAVNAGANAVGGAVGGLLDKVAGALPQGASSSMPGSGSLEQMKNGMDTGMGTGITYMEMMLNGSLSCNPLHGATDSSNSTGASDGSMENGKAARTCSLQELTALGSKSTAEVLKAMSGIGMGCKPSLKVLENIPLPGGLDLSKLKACSEEEMKALMAQKEGNVISMALSGNLKCLPKEMIEGGMGGDMMAGSKLEAPSKEVMGTVGKLLVGCKEAACLAKAKEALSSAASGLSEKAKNTYLNKLSGEAAKEAAKEGVKDCLAKDKSAKEKEACFKAANEALGAATETLLGNRSAEVKAKVQKELAKEAARDALGNSLASCLAGAGGAKEACLTQVAGDLAAAGLEGESPRNIRDVLFRKKIAEAAEDCSNSTCRKAAKQAALDAGMEEREYAAVKSLGDVKAAAEIYSNCKLAGEEDSECISMARADYVASSGAREEDFSEELKARVMKLGEALLNGVPVVMVRLKRMVATVIASAAACDTSLEDWFTTTCLSRAKAKESKAESAKKKKCAIVDGMVQYLASVDVNVSEAEIDSLSAHIAGSFEGQTLGAATRLRRLGEAAAPRRLATVTETYASQDVAECPESDAACLSGEPSTEGPAASPAASPTPSSATGNAAGPTAAPAASPSTTPSPSPASSAAPVSEPVAAAHAGSLGALTTLAVLLVMFK